MKFAFNSYFDSNVTRAKLQKHGLIIYGGLLAFSILSMVVTFISNGSVTPMSLLLAGYLTSFSIFGLGIASAMMLSLVLIKVVSAMLVASYATFTVLRLLFVFSDRIVAPLQSRLDASQLPPEELISIDELVRIFRHDTIASSVISGLFVGFILFLNYRYHVAITAADQQHEQDIDIGVQELGGKFPSKLEVE